MLQTFIESKFPKFSLNLKALLGEEALREGVRLVLDQLALGALAGVYDGGDRVPVVLRCHELDDLRSVDRTVLLHEAHLQHHAGVVLLEKFRKQSI